MKKMSFGMWVFIYFCLIGGAILFSAPLLWMLSTALKPLDQTMSLPPTFVPYEYRYSGNAVRLIEQCDKHCFLIKTDDGQGVTVVDEENFDSGKMTLLQEISADKEHLWTVCRSEDEYLAVPSCELTRHWRLRWENFSGAVKAMKYFPRYLYNTVLLCFLTVIETLVSSTLAAYGFSHIEWKGRDKIFLIALATMMIPFPVVMVPLYCLFRELGLIGTLAPLWIGSFGAGAFNVFLLRQFFMGIPKSLSEAARIDGCSEFRIFLSIILPVSKPALTVVGLFQFMATWNDFLGPLLYLTNQKDYTLALGLQFFQSQSGGTDWNYLMAASTLIVLPVIILFFVAQKSFIEGISTSGIKG